MDPRKWDVQTWVAVITFLGSVVFGTWRVWRWYHWNEERELRRIYRKAAMLGESDTVARLGRAYRRVMGRSTQDDEMRISLRNVIESEDFWRRRVLPGRIALAQEKERCRTLLLECKGHEQWKEVERALDSFYDSVLDSMESSKNERWRSRAERELQRREVEREVKATQKVVGVNEEQEPILIGGADLNQVATQQDRLREMFEWALTHDTENALHVAYNLSIIHDLHGQRNEALQVLRKSLYLVLEKRQEAPKKLQIRVLSRAAHLANKQGYCDEAERYAEVMLKLSHEVEQDLDVATALQRLGRSKYFRCDSEISSKLLEESLLSFLELKPIKFREIAWVQFDLGLVAVNQNDLPSALSWLKKSLFSYQKAKGNGEQVDKNGEGTIRVNLAFVLHKQGDWKAAHEQMATAAELLNVGGSPESYYRWYLHFLGRLDFAEKDFDSARARFYQSWEIFRDRNERLGIIRSLLGFSLLAAQEKEWTKASMLLGSEEEMRKREFDVPFPLDWGEEKNFIETKARHVLGDSAFNTALEKGKKEWKQIIENLPAFLKKS